MDRFKGRKGITAMVLIFSILILIVIAGISISAIVGDNGVLDNALSAKEQAEVETYTEELEVLEVQAKTEQINDGMSTKEYIDEMKEKVLSSTIFSENISDADEQITEVNSSTLRVETDEGYIFIVTEDGIEYVESDEEIEYSITADDVTITLDPSSWTNTDVLVTVTIDFDTTATIQYSLDGSTYYDYDDSTGVTVSTNGTFYVQLVNSDGDLLTDDVISADIGIIDKLDPVLSSVTIGSVTTSTISVNVDAYDASATSYYGCSGIDHYEYSCDGGETWVESDDSSYTFKGLTNGTEYTIVVKIVDKAGNEVISDITEDMVITTNEIPDLSTEDEEDDDGETVEANVVFEYDPTDWTNTFVTVTVTLSDEIQALIDDGTYVLEYTTDDPTDEDSWSEYLSSGIIMQYNGTVHVRLSDETNSGNYVSGSVSNIDKTLPVIESLEATTSTITIVATDSSDGTDGVSGIVGYYYSTDSEIPDEDDFIDCSDDGEGVTELEQTITGLTADKTYYIYVIDDAGNISSVGEQATDPMASPEGIIEFEYNPDDWTNGVVVVTAVTSDESYQIQMTQTPDVDSSWEIKTDNSITLSVNGTVYARLYDGLNYSNYISGTVTHIDKLAPYEFENFAITDYTTSTITVTGSTTDREATDSYGCSGIEAYYYSSDGGTTWLPASGTEETEYTFEGLSQGMTYTLVMKAVDYAGNETISGTLTRNNRFNRG